MARVGVKAVMSRRTMSSFARPAWLSNKFSSAQHGDFVPQPPRLSNPYLADAPLLSALQRQLPTEALSEVATDLKRFGDRIVDEVDALGRECEQHPPRLTQQDAWGQRIQDLWTCEAWKRQKAISAEEGLVAVAHERRLGEWSRLHQLIKLYMYSPSAGLYTCPLAMTDGAARTLEVLGFVGEAGASANPELVEAHRRLTTRDPSDFWTSGQWMTERRGGSDVASGTETLAIRDPALPHGEFRLFGYKWFSSATDADMTLTLARIADRDTGATVPGNKGLSLFYVRLRDPSKGNELDNIDMIRLKDKLGTRQLPTAELLLHGTRAIQLTPPGRGISGISQMLNITRVYNSACSVGPMRRLLSLARDFAFQREAFGSRIIDHSLHAHTIAAMEVEHRGCLLLLLRVGEWLGRAEVGIATDQEKLLLRLLVPVMKLYTAKRGVAACSELLEAFGGQGYMEDTGLPTMFRDSQVLPIWEGTTNVLSLDVLRAIQKTAGEVLIAYGAAVRDALTDSELSSSDELRKSAGRVAAAVDYIEKFAVMNQPDVIQVAAREFSYSLARTYIGALLVAQANSRSATRAEQWTAVRWCLDQDLCPVKTSYEAGLFSSEGLNAAKDMLELCPTSNGRQSRDGRFNEHSVRICRY